MGRSSRNHTRIGNAAQTTLDSWLGVMQLDAGQQLDLSIVDAAAEVVDTLHTRRRGLRGSLRRMGNAMGDLGWPLEQLNTWIAELSILSSRSHRGELRSFESVSALAEGWAERYVRGAHSGACIDAVTGLGTPTVLRMRLKEIFQHCRTFGIAPSEAYCFVVVDADADDLAPFERDAVMITTAGVVTEVFQHGETVIRHRGRVIVLASKSEATRQWTATLTEALRAAPITRSADLAVWTDELPESTIDLDRHLRTLVG
jgi:GGDEF domain-containing protein